MSDLGLHCSPVSHKKSARLVLELQTSLILLMFNLDIPSLEKSVDTDHHNVNVDYWLGIFTNHDGKACDS